MSMKENEIFDKEIVTEKENNATRPIFSVLKFIILGLMIGIYVGVIFIAKEKGLLVDSSSIPFRILSIVPAIGAGLFMFLGIIQTYRGIVCCDEIDKQNARNNILFSMILMLIYTAIKILSFDFL